MATSFSSRSAGLPTLPDRRSSLSSNRGSHRSSNSYSNSFGHQKVPSHGSVGVQSTRSSNQSSQRIQAPLEHAITRKGPRLKSQYPLNASEPHVEYILVASFDIDRGPIMEHQYPGIISSDENMLAELMLPDQTHMRKQDWTMFFLHKDGGLGDNDEDEEVEERRELKRQRRAAREQRRLAGSEAESSSEEDSSDEDNDELEGPSLMYVLNLVNTKQDSTVKRGAIVKAMAICTRHSFLHIYKPLLLLALEEYFKTPTQDSLEMLYNSLNSMDLSLMPRLSLLERHVLQANDVKDLFIEKFERMLDQQLDDKHSARSPIPLESIDRAAFIKQGVPRDTHDFDSKIVYNGIPVPVKIPTAPSLETVGDFSLVQLVHTFNAPHVSQPQPFALHPHLTTSGANTHPILVLINAMLTEKRVIFLGHNRPSGEVAEAVLAACALASGGVLRGFTRYAFPYTDLTKIDELLKVPGFIAGVTNPAFSYHPEWWDLLVDLPSGRMKISSNIDPAPVTEGSTYFQQQTSNLQKDNNHDATGDIAFMEDIVRSIDSRQGESVIRSKFRSYITKFTRIAAAFEETVYGASSLTVLPPTEVEKPNVNGTSRASVASARALKGHGYIWPNEEAKARELAATAAKIEGWRNTRTYYAFISDLAAHSRDPSTPLSPKGSQDVFNGRAPKAYLDIYHCLSKLRTLRLLPSEAGPIYLALEAYCDDYNSVLELLVQAPLSEAGLFHVSLGLWHEDIRVREATALLLERIRRHPAGRIFFSRLGGFANAGFSRVRAEREARSHLDE